MVEIEGEREPVAEGWEWDKKWMGGVKPEDVGEKVVARWWRGWRCRRCQCWEGVAVDLELEGRWQLAEGISFISTVIDIIM